MDEENLLLRLPCDLQWISLISFGTGFWERPDVKTEIKEFFERSDPQQQTKVHWNSMTELIISKHLVVNLPLSLLKILKSVIILVGDQIFFWLLHAVKDLKIFEFKFFEKIYWATYGIIDEVKTYESVWQKYYGEAIVHQYDCSHYERTLLCYAVYSTYCQETFIRSLFKELKTAFPSCFRNGINYDNVLNVLLLSLTATYSHKNKLFQGVETLKHRFNNNSSITEVQFELCVTYGFRESAAHFFSKLEINNPLRLLLHCANKLINLASSKSEINPYQIRKTADSLLFLLHKMTLEERLNYLKYRGTHCFQIFLKTWPHQELCLPLLNLIWDGLKDSSKKHVLFQILNFLSGSYEYKIEFCTQNKKIGQDLLQSALERTTKEIKEKVFLDKGTVLFNLFKIFDFSTVNIIINDNDLSKHREKFIHGYLWGFLMNRNYDLEAKYNFVQELTISANERELFEELFCLIKQKMIGIQPNKSRSMQPKV